MKKFSILKAAGAALATLAILSSCVGEAFEEITSINLARCLEPQNLSAKVDVATGDYVTFGWDVNKDADSYNLVVYTDEAMITVPALDETILPADVPYTVRLTADQKYYFKVQALSETKQASNWAVYDGHASTYAVKDNLFMEIVTRTSTSVSLKWSTEVSDYKEVTHIEASPVKGGSKVKYDLVDADKNSGTATVSGLSASTEYQLVLYYMSASRGAVDAWTMAEPGTMTQVSTSEALVAAVNAGGEIYLTLAGSPYTLGASKPTASVHIVGEMGADGSMPVVAGNFDVSSICASGMDIICENILFNDGEVHNHLVNYSGGETTLGTVKFVNCGITHFKAGLFYNNKTATTDVLTVGDIIFDSCDIYEVATAPGGDCVDFRKNTHSTVKSIQIVNCSIWDGIRTLFRLGDQAGEDLTITEGMKFENNTVKAIVTIDNTNNRGVFAIRVPVNMTLKKNLFLYVDGGKTADGTEDYAQLFQNKGETVIPTLTAEDNYAFACGKDFFIKATAAETGFTVLSADPCYNSKGNFFQLANADLISKKVGAPKWWISYVEKEEDLTQNVLAGAHVWNLQDASLFAGEIKNSRVRDELLLVGSEAAPLSGNNGINFLGASALNKKGQPTEGYLSFKVNTPGSVDLLVADGGASSVVVALFDDNGYAVQGGVMTPSKGDVQKVIIPKVTGEGTVYLYSTGAISLTKLAWSLDATGGDRVLATPQPKVDPVTITEGDATAVTVTWSAIDHAAGYKLVFKNKAYSVEEATYTIAGEDVAALTAGLFSVTVQAVPADGDIYYQESAKGSASFAVQPKGGAGVEVEKTLLWNFSDADWVEELAAKGTAGSDITNWSSEVNDLKFNSTSKSKWNKRTIGDETWYYIQFGGKSNYANNDRVFKFTAPAAGKLYVTVSNTGNDPATDGRAVAVRDASGTEQTTVCKVGAASPEVMEFEVEAGEVAVYTVTNGLAFYQLKFDYKEIVGGGPVKEDHVWNFSDADWVEELAAKGTAGSDITNWSSEVNNLKFNSTSKSKWNKRTIGDQTWYYIQFGGKSNYANNDRVFKFTVGVAGTVSITVSNTGNDPATDGRAVAVKDASGTEQTTVCKVGATSPEVMEFEVEAGEVAVYTVTNGLAFYKIEFHSK